MRELFFPHVLFCKYSKHFVPIQKKIKSKKAEWLRVSAAFSRVAGAVRRVRQRSRIAQTLPEKLYQRRSQKAKGRIEKEAKECPKLFFPLHETSLMPYVYWIHTVQHVTLYKCTSLTFSFLGYKNLSRATAEGLFTNIGSLFFQLFGTDTLNYRQEM